MHVVSRDEAKNIPARVDLSCAALLYPGPEAALLDTISPRDAPSTLVIIDGTWSHARRLLFEMPWLVALPRVALAPSAPTRYRIRKAPSATALSTVEATAQALSILEPNNTEITRLLETFEAMIDMELETRNRA